MDTLVYHERRLHKGGGCIRVFETGIDCFTYKALKFYDEHTLVGLILPKSTL